MLDPSHLKIALNEGDLVFERERTSVPSTFIHSGAITCVCIPGDRGLREEEVHWGKGNRSLVTTASPWTYN